MTGYGKWAVAGVPHRDWQCVGILDREEPVHLCEMCETQMVRYVHVMHHPSYPNDLSVGCICAGHMEENRTGARQREQKFRNHQARRARWLHRKWRLSCNGNDYIKSEGFLVVVFPKGNIWGARVEHLESGVARVSQRPYTTKEAAKLAAFEVMVRAAVLPETAKL